MREAPRTQAHIAVSERVCQRGLYCCLDGFQRVCLRGRQLAPPLCRMPSSRRPPQILPSCHWHCLHAKLFTKSSSDSIRTVNEFAAVFQRNAVHPIGMGPAAQAIGRLEHKDPAMHSQTSRSG